MSRTTPQALESPDPTDFTGLRGRFSPLRFLIITIGGIFLAEVIAMTCLLIFKTLPYYLQTLIDAGIMLVLISPIIYYFSLRPLLLHIENRQKAEVQLREMALFPTLNPDAVLQVDATGHIIKSNPSAAQMGLSVGGHLTELIPDLSDLDLPECIIEGTTQHMYEARLGERVLQWTIRGAPQLGLAFLYSQDITERKQSEEAIRLLSSVVEQTADTVVVTDCNGVIEYVNPAVENITGYVRQDILGKTPRVLKSGVHGDQFYNELWRTILKGEVFHGEMTNRTKNGELLHEVKTITPLRDAQGNITHFVATGKNITDRKEAEEKLRVAYDEMELRVQERTEELVVANAVLVEEIKERERIQAQLTTAMSRLEAHIDNSPLAVIEFDPEFHVTRWSAEAERMFGWKAEEVVGHSISELDWVYEEDVQSVLRVSEEMLSGKSPRNLNTNRNYRKDRSVIHCEWYNSAIYNAEGQLTSIQAQVLDITERKRADEALRESEERFYKAFHFSPVGVNIFRLADGRSVDVNDAFLELTGYSREEFVGHSSEELNLLPNLEDRAVWMKRLREQGAVRNIDTQICKKSGQIANVLFSIVQIDVNSELMGLVLTIDITERKQAEEELYKLNRTLKALSDSNQIMMRAVSEAEYLEQVCKVIVNDCGHLMVWIGYAEDDANRSVRPVASAGFEAGYLETLKITWADNERGRGPTGTAIRTGRPSRCRNMLTDPQFEPWRADALKRGYASSIVLPLLYEGKTMGALNIYSREPDPFSEDEERLLTELAKDLAYGVTSIRLRQALADTSESLRLSDERFRLALKNAPVTVATQDKDLRFTWAYNQRTVDPGMIVGRTDTDLFPPEFASRLMALKCQVLENGTEIKEQMWVSSGGHRLYLEIYLEPIRDTAGQIIGVGIATVDLTERKQAEEALCAARDELDLRVQERTKELAIANRELLNEIADRKEIERQLQIQATAMEAAANGIIITDLEGNIMWTNPALTQMSGYSENELLGQSTRIFNSGKHASEFYREMWSTILAGNVWKGETINRRKDGSQYIEGQTITPVRKEDGEISHFIAIKEDITEQKRIEAEILERNRKEKSLIQMVHTMQVDIARDLHDTIGQNISYLRMKLDYMMEKDLSAKGGELKSEFSQMSQVANESYDLVRGTLAILQSQSPDDLLQLFKRYASQVVERSALKIEFTSQGEVGFISTHQMRQFFYIFREALSNIEKYSGAGYVSVNMKWCATTVELSIEDDGKGFDVSLIAVSPGHYGLRFMRERTEMMNGSFQVKTELGRGTRIIITVPIQRDDFEK